MPPDGTLTPAQHEILDVVWASGSRGVTVAEIRDAIASRREVTRTTVLNLVDRLERRGWLRVRAGGEGRGRRFVAAVERTRAERHLAEAFVDDFFDGSPSALVEGLLGGESVDDDELRRLEELIAARRAQRGARRPSRGGRRR